MGNEPQPKITVSICTNRTDLFFRRAVHSIKNQKTPPDEVVVVIDGFSWKMGASKILGEMPPEWKIFWTESEDSGPAMVRNLGMHYATGDWIAILDGDDFIVPSFIESYAKILSQTKADIVTEFSAHYLIHQGIVSRSMPPDRSGWNEVLRLGSKGILSGGYKKGDIPMRPVFIRNEGKKYYPIDFNILEDKVLLLQYIIEERRIAMSDYCGYIRNAHPLCYSTILSKTRWAEASRDEARFKRIAANTSIQWPSRDKVFETCHSNLYLTEDDFAYIEDTVKYFSEL